jgi:hypothetical protein
MGELSELKEIEAPSMIADAIKEAAKLGRRAADAEFDPLYTKVRESEEEEFWLSKMDLGAKATIERMPRARKRRRLEFLSLGSFADWVSHFDPDGNPVVLVDEEAVVAQWNLTGHEAAHVARLPLELSESWRALERLFAGVGQQELHKLLSTSLSGHVDDLLMMQIAKLSHVSTSELNVDIKRTGLGDAQARQAMRLFFSGPEGQDDADIEVNWEYIGPVWTCFQEPITIPLRMVISKQEKGGLVFEFAPVGKEAALIAYRGALCVELGVLVGDAAVV